MDKLMIYRFQLEHLKDTLRVVANTLNSRDLNTCLDRDIMQSIGFVDNALEGDIDRRVNRYSHTDVNQIGVIGAQPLSLHNPNLAAANLSKHKTVLVVDSDIRRGSSFEMSDAMKTAKGQQFNSGIVGDRYVVLFSLSEFNKGSGDLADLFSQKPDGLTFVEFDCAPHFVPQPEECFIAGGDLFVPFLSQEYKNEKQRQKQKTVTSRLKSQNEYLMGSLLMGAATMYGNTDIYPYHSNHGMSGKNRETQVERDVSWKIAEFDLICQKKSKLSSNQRDAIKSSILKNYRKI